MGFTTGKKYRGGGGGGVEGEESGTFLTLSHQGKRKWPAEKVKKKRGTRWPEYGKKNWGLKELHGCLRGGQGTGISVSAGKKWDTVVFGKGVVRGGEGPMHLLV